MIQIYKIMHGLVGVSEESLLTMVGMDRGTRGNTFKIQKQHARLKLRENAFSNRVTDTWNKLPESVVLAKSVNLYSRMELILRFPSTRVL